MAMIPTARSSNNARRDKDSAQSRASVDAVRENRRSIVLFGTWKQPTGGPGDPRATSNRRRRGGRRRRRRARPTRSSSTRSTTPPTRPPPRSATLSAVIARGGALYTQQQYEKYETAYQADAQVRVFERQAFVKRRGPSQ